jgi:hypothetical protein
MKPVKLSREQLDGTPWAIEFKAKRLPQYEEAARYALAPDLAVSIVRTNETGEWVWAITAVSHDSEFWLDAKQTKLEALALCKAMGWRVHFQDVSKPVSHYRVGPWIDVDHCATRVLEGADPADTQFRVCFIEKTARVRVFADRYAWQSKDSEFTCGAAKQDAWIYGHRGDGHLCGKDPASRAWCDALLRLLGYEFPEDEAGSK